MVAKQIADNLSHSYHNFDTLKIGERKTATFIYTGKQEIRELKTSCFCLSTRRTKYLDRTEIRVTWTAKPTPKINRPSKKTVDIIFDNGDETTLILEAIITK